MKIKNLLISLTLETVLISSVWASHLDDGDRMSAQLALSRKMTETRGQLQHNHDKWWNDFEIGTQRKLENVPAYLNNLANTNPEAAAWFIAGARYGLCIPPMTDQQRTDMRSAREKVANAEAALIKEGKQGFLNNVHVVFKTGEAVLEKLIKDVDRLTGRVSFLENRVVFLEKEIAGIPLLLQKEKSVLDNKIITLESERKAEVSKLNLRITNLEKENKKFSEQISETNTNARIQTAVETAVKGLKDEYLTEKQDREKAVLKEKKDLENSFATERNILQSIVDSFKTLSETNERKALNENNDLKNKIKELEEKAENEKKEKEGLKKEAEKKEAEIQATILGEQLKSEKFKTEMLTQMNQMLNGQNTDIKKQLLETTNAYNGLLERYRSLMETLRTTYPDVYNGLPH